MNCYKLFLFLLALCYTHGDPNEAVLNEHQAASQLTKTNLNAAALRFRQALALSIRTSYADQAIILNDLGVTYMRMVNGFYLTNCMPEAKLLCM